MVVRIKWGDTYNVFSTISGKSQTPNNCEKNIAISYIYVTG